MNILALGAHPDDVEFLCGGTMIKFFDRGHSTFIALTTSGNTGSNVIETKEKIAAIREAEQLEAAKLCGAQVRFLGFDDESVADTPQHRIAVMDAIRWADPDVILTNPPWDPSTDHGMTGKLVMQAMAHLDDPDYPCTLPPVRKKPSIFFWEMPGGLNQQPEIYVDISAQMGRKQQAIAAHKSQYDWVKDALPSGFEDYSSSLSKYRGTQAELDFAEGFVSCKICGFPADPRLLP